MDRLITCAGMRALERRQIEAGLVGGTALMERAGQGVVDAVLAEWPDLAVGAHRATLLCGPGNNGGDGFVVARLLRRRGWKIDLLFHGTADGLGADARANHDAWCSVGTVVPLDLAEGGWQTRLDHALSGDGPGARLVIDALFGIGLSRPIGDLVHVMRALAEVAPDGSGNKPHMVAVDLPSGLCGESGRALCDAPQLGPVSGFRADLTVTFHRPKPGHVLGDGPAFCGALAVVDIGLPQHGQGDDIALITGAGGVAKRGGHKFDHGHAVVLTGGAGRTGAARMAARAAQRVGAGLVTLGVPPAAQFEVAAQITSAMLTRIGDGAALARMLEDRRINSLCLGPGLGLGDREAGLVGTALSSGRRLVLDADALSLLAVHGDLFANLHDDCVLTPHGGEFARLFPDLADRFATQAAVSKVEVARCAAERAGCVVLFKGADTVIAAPDGRAAIHAAAYDRAAPWLATAGAGDVLAGLIAGLLAREVTPFAATCSAAWLHVECALDFGPGLIAEDLPERLPAVLRRL